MGRPKVVTVCTAEDCTRGEHTRGLCKKHYTRYQRGDKSLKLLASHNSPSVSECAIEGCDKGGPYIRGWCQGHYGRYKKYGYVDPTPVRPMIDRRGTPQERLDRQTDKTSSTEGCWLWLGWKNSNGYGSISVNNKAVLTHRLSYDLHHGTKSHSGQPIHHVCGVKACLNPEHLQRITSSENTAEMRERLYYQQRIKELEAQLKARGIDPA